jgi:hypothetical protein
MRMNHVSCLPAVRRPATDRNDNEQISGLVGSIGTIFLAATGTFLPLQRRSYSAGAITGQG